MNKGDVSHYPLTLCEADIKVVPDPDHGSHVSALVDQQESDTLWHSAMFSLNYMLLSSRLYEIPA
jgi:hypothetical protein